LKKSLYFPCLAGNWRRRQVHLGLPPPPPRAKDTGIRHSPAVMGACPGSVLLLRLQMQNALQVRALRVRVLYVYGWFHSFSEE
jgi:hypothetical protein